MLLKDTVTMKLTYLYFLLPLHLIRGGDASELKDVEACRGNQILTLACA